MSDVIIANARIVDPEKETETTGSIFVEGGKIREILPGPLPERFLGNPAVLDASGLVASPGFIDVHAHTDGDVPCAEKLLAQGVTTALGGNCGLSPLDIRGFLDEQDARGFPINQAELIGHSFCLRKAAGIDDPYRAATDREIVTMKGLARAALDMGAAGLSFGIQYAPGTSNLEYRELAAVSAGYGRIIPVHTRLDYPNDFDSLRETLDIARDTGARVLVSHLAYMYADGEMNRALDLIAEYQARGCDIWADSGMYTDFETYAGTTCFDERHIVDYGWTYTNFLAGSGRYAGSYLTKETFLDIRANSPDDLLICFTGVEDDIYKALLYPDVMVSSDTGPAPAGQGHPQGAAVYPRFFRVMVREKRLMTLVEAVRRCTLVPARALNLRHKGRLAPGADADIVLFDLGAIKDTASFPGIGDPDAAPEGIPHVMVGGEWARLHGARVGGIMRGRTIRY